MPDEAGPMTGGPNGDGAPFIDRMAPRVKQRQTDLEDLLPRYGDLSNIIQMSNLSRTGVVRLARALAWSSRWERWVQSDTGFRVLESILMSTAAVGGERARLVAELRERAQNASAGPALFMMRPSTIQDDAAGAAPGRAVRTAWREANQEPSEPKKPRGLFGRG